MKNYNPSPFLPLAMNSSEKLHLKWKDFQENINSAFGKLRNQEDFTDVTLASDDGTQIQSYKVLLASLSPFFMEILKRNKHPHPLIVMRGTKTEELVALLDFLSHGEVYVAHQDLAGFLALADDLGLKGLSHFAENHESSGKADFPKAEIGVKRKHSELDSKVANSKQPMTEEGTSAATGVSHPYVEVNYVELEKLNEQVKSIEVSVELEELDEQVKSMMEVSENMARSRGNRSERAWLCKVCGKEGRKVKIMSHVEANHVRTNALLPCDLCGNSSRSRHGLKLHKTKYSNLIFQIFAGAEMG